MKTNAASWLYLGSREFKYRVYQNNIQFIALKFSKKIQSETKQYISIF